ncbi:MAG: hypothetical protein WDO73_02225 [Ignavibacteriota bacterium]
MKVGMVFKDYVGKQYWTITKVEPNPDAGKITAHGKAPNFFYTGECSSWDKPEEKVKNVPIRGDFLKKGNISKRNGGERCLARSAFPPRFRQSEIEHLYAVACKSLRGFGRAAEI